MTKLPDGLYDLLVTQAIQQELAQLGPHRRADVEPLEPADSHLLLARHLAAIARTALRGLPEEERVARQTQLTNELLQAIAASLPKEVAVEDYVAEPPHRLAAVYPIDALKSRRPAAPAIPLSQSDLLVNARDEPRIGTVLEKEIESADRVDLIIAFIRWSGLRLVAPRLRTLVERGGRLRVITTTYTGSTQRSAIEQLLDLGASPSSVTATTAGGTWSWRRRARARPSWPHSITAD
ncbi:MAG TPA: hypothetical protein VEO54_18285 [Thermoanaerobaculia bacterium]|nr:hypothetical protein [Thermoanaerobaculia bacterium]